MIYKSTYFFLITIFLATLQACGMQSLSEVYQPTTPGYEAARAADFRKSINNNRITNIATGTPVQNPNNVPVIINDPYAISRELANSSPATSGLGGNVFIQGPNGLVPSNSYNNPYGSLANTENQIITPNVLMQNSNNPRPYQRPSFGSNYYRPY